MAVLKEWSTQMPDTINPHGAKLNALLSNPKLPASDLPRIRNAVEHYNRWRQDLNNIDSTASDALNDMIAKLNSYKNFIDLETIFDSADDFLYRQKGQLKIDNSVIEEFVPLLVDKLFGQRIQGLGLSIGPTTTFSSMRFEEDMQETKKGGGLVIQSKDQDFSMNRRVFIRTSHQSDFADSITVQSAISYVASEIKTNLDKTMFQEAAATALNLKAVVPGARYYLLCEWLDMAPISTATTAIDEILILRRARRLSADVRSAFGTAQGRRMNRNAYSEYLHTHPIASEPFSRLIDHIGSLLAEHTEEDVVNRGYF